jgi:hypothetical protein
MSESPKEKLAKRKAFVAEVKRISVKMLPNGSNRDRNEPPLMCLTKDERLIFAQHLEERNHLVSAEFVRNWTEKDTLEWIKKRKKEKQK